MPRYALIGPSNQIDRFATNVDPSVQTKTGWRWLPADPVAPPAYNATTEVREGPTYTVGANAVTETWSVRSKTSQEIDADKDAAVNALEGAYQAQLKILLQVVNDNRDVRAKLNALIDATGQAGTVAKYPAGQTTQINTTQLKNAIKALL